MRVDWMMIANYAEVRDGLLYVMGGGVDTINVHAPPEGAPPEVFTVIEGTLVVRVLFHHTETNREHTFELTITDADGKQIARMEGGMRVDRIPGLPPGWDQNVNLVLPLTGIALPGPGTYSINVQLNGQFLSERPFRVLKLF